MSTVNVQAGIARPAPLTHEGATASRITPEQELRRTVMACLLWEDTFYEDGISVAERIANLVPQVDPRIVSQFAIEARERMRLRHVPLWLIRQMASLPTHRSFVALTLERVIQRADELTEFLAQYQLGRAGRKKLNKLSKQVQRGIARAFIKFDEYQLAKYNRQKEITLRDALFLSHAKPKDEAQAELWKRLIADELKIPDTWEVELSASEDKKASWERLLSENRLGTLALLRNLRNMKQAGVAEGLVLTALESAKVGRVLPFRFIAAAAHAPQWESQLETLMFKSLDGVQKLPGKTALIVDRSGSMSDKISSRSELRRIDAAGSLAILLREICEQVIVIAFSNHPEIVPARRGFALRDAIGEARGGTNTNYAIDLALQEGYDRIIVATDEQSHQPIQAQVGRGYFINVGSYQNGIGYGKWLHIDGWSEAVIDYIQEYERTDGVQ